MIEQAEIIESLSAFCKKIILELAQYKNIEREEMTLRSISNKDNTAIKVMGRIYERK